MSRRRRKRQQLSVKEGSAELNIMPFIDIFSMLVTFLLMSATFINIGIVRVQVPFFSSRSPENEKPTRVFQVKLDIRKDKVTLETEYSRAPVNKSSTDYPLDEKGIEALHNDLIRARMANQETDLVTVYSDDDVIYDNLMKVVDAVKNLKPGDKFNPPSTKDGEPLEQSFLYPKVVIGSVIL